MEPENDICIYIYLFIWFLNHFFKNSKGTGEEILLLTGCGWWLGVSSSDRILHKVFLK